jgi:predicted secreted Zn-dependent protease
LRLAILASVIACLAGSVAAAERDGITAKVTYYAISGETPRDMFLSMVKRGPKGGFGSRAIAQTQYHTDWSTTLSYANGACRVVRAEPRTTITYIYPRRPDGMSKSVGKKWDRFMTGIMRHERQHGRYVREMLAEAKKSILGLKIHGDENCKQTRAEMKRRVSRIHDLYEAKQRAFDVREHRDDANIDRLIKAFVNE